MPKARINLHHPYKAPYMVLTLDDFIDDCVSGCLIDYDGFGYYSNSRTQHDDLDELRVYPSQITQGGINRDYKYVHWYNR